MQLLGYSDVWSVRPNGTIRFFVHCEQESFSADLVRLIHGDTNPRGPGFKETELPEVFSGRFPGQRQTIRTGSYGSIAMPDGTLSDGDFSVQAWIWSTMPDAGPQALVSHGTPDTGAGFALLINERGQIEFRLGHGRSGDGRGAAVVSTEQTVAAREWTFVGAAYERSTGQATVFSHQRRFAPGGRQDATVNAAVADAKLECAGSPALLGAVDGAAPAQFFNGKIADPRLFRRSMGLADGLDRDGEPVTDRDDLIAFWDLADGIAGDRITDRGRGQHHGRTINRPTRGVTGPAWSGAAPSFALDPSGFNAIHFHEDDTADAGWEEGFAFTVPGDLRSGVYAMRLRAGAAEDHLPFFVRPPAGAATAAIAVLMPTLTYLAYANESVDVSDSLALAPIQNIGRDPDMYAYVAANGLKSTYNHHRDGSGICISALQRPILNFRPKSRCRIFDAPHLFSADLYLIDWLEAKGLAYDVITDHDLHREGSDALTPHRVVLTGSHPEYWSAEMLDGLEDYLGGGGRLMYLGGNGFYWATAVDPADGTSIEIRRWGGTRTWQAEPGEYALSLTGEMGGLWRDRGRAPQKLVGVGFTAQGFDRASPYRRTPASYTDRAAFIFEGIAGDIVGDIPALVLNHGAGGFEVDKADARLGTPAHAMVLASTVGHSDAYQRCVEELLSASPATGGTANTDIGGDVVLLEYPNGGAVFSVGSINWTATLSHDGYGGDTSRITENVLRAFSSGDWG